MQIISIFLCVAGTVLAYALVRGLYLRYMFEDMNGAMELPVSPYRSPYSN